MTLKVISAESVLFEGEVEWVSLPGQMGAFTVLHNHASLVSTLVPGIMGYGLDGQTVEQEIGGGVVDVDKNVVSVCIY